MSPTKSKTKTSPKAASSQARTPKLIRGFPGTDEERAAQRRRFAEKHRETLRRLGK
jgi:hypothetical protein